MCYSKSVRYVGIIVLSQTERIMKIMNTIEVNNTFLYTINVLKKFFCGN